MSNSFAKYNFVNKINLKFIQLMYFKNNGGKPKSANQIHLNSL